MTRFWLRNTWLWFVMFLSGCSTVFDGTWLFQWDLDGTLTTSSDSCPEQDDVKFKGDEYEWIDIYTTTGGALVLTNGDEEWVGVVSDDSFSVSTTFGESDDQTYYYHSTEDLIGTLAGEDMAGQSDDYRTTCVVDEGCEDEDDECKRHTRRSFKGVRIDGSRDTYRTIRAGHQESSSTE